MVEFLFHVVRRSVLAFLHIPANAPLSFHRVGAFQQPHTGISLYSHQLKTYLVLPLPKVSALMVVSNGKPSGSSLICARMFFISSLFVKNFLGSPLCSILTIQRSSALFRMDSRLVVLDHDGEIYQFPDAHHSTREALLAVIWLVSDFQILE